VQRAVAVVDSTVSDIPVATLHSVLARQPDVAIGLIRHLATRLQDARDDAARLVFDDCNQRLLKTLVRFSESAAATRHENDVVLRITHQQLAQAVGAARETISLALTQLRQRNLLHTGRNRLTFNAQVLRGLVERTVSPCAGVADENGSDSNASVRSADSAAAQSAPQQPRTQAAQVA
jgi:CRP/FNR family transcriptional regulator